MLARKSSKTVSSSWEGMTMAKRTRKEQDLEMMTLLIREGLDLGETKEQIASTMVDGDGFTFDIRYDSSEYVSSTDFTRREGVTLTAEEFAACYATALTWP
jgi:hypothetical protein